MFYSFKPFVFKFLGVKIMYNIQLFLINLTVFFFVHHLFNKKKLTDK